MANSIFNKLIIIGVLLTRSNAVELPNEKLPIDINNNTILSGEAAALKLGVNGAPGVGFVFYYNNWGGCAGTNCCASRSGCRSCCFRGAHDHDCVDGTNHSIVAYHVTPDLQTFTPLGIVFHPNLGDAILYRQHVIYSPVLDKFVMWYKVYNLNLTQGPGHWYGVATASQPQGPFEIEVAQVPNTDLGDLYLFVDGADAYLITFKFIQRLNASFTGLDTSPHSQTTLPVPARWEAPIMFTRDGKFYVIGGHNCCACTGGSNAFVFRADTPLGHYAYLGDINVNASANQTDESCPYLWTTHAQTATVFEVMEAGKTSPTIVMMSNQWVSAGPPAYARNQDLLYFNALEFNESGYPQPIIRQPSLFLNISSTVH
eukprot:m.12416 g.12416  ORF g.12416 m.12416 type:complete len:372 (+) comp4649_c0_seq1:41-1156(+)